MPLRTTIDRPLSVEASARYRRAHEVHRVRGVVGAALVSALLVLSTSGHSVAQVVDCSGAMARDPECQPGELVSRDMARVRDVQTRLSLLGFDPGPADGIPGRRTSEALAAFYASLDRPARTTFDAQTLADLQAALTGGDAAGQGGSERSARRVRQLEEQLERARHSMNSDLLSTRNGAAAALSRHAR